MAVADEHVVQEEAPGLGLLGPRTRHLLALEFGAKAQFDDPRLEWRRLFSELLGTFMLVLVAAGLGVRAFNRRHPKVLPSGEEKREATGGYK